jgi:uncharacterized protein
MSHRGSILATPAGIRLWPVTPSPKSRTRRLQPILDEAEEIDFC